MLLCDADHGLVHDHDLVLSRRNGRLIVLTPDGRHVWGGADAAFTSGLSGVDPAPAAAHADDTTDFRGVQPIDTVAGRRPIDAPQLQHDAPPPPRPGRPLRRRTGPPRRPDLRRPGGRHTGGRGTAAPVISARAAGRPPGRRRGRLAALGATSPTGGARNSARLGRVLFPDGEPTLPDSLQERCDRMDLRFAIGVLMGNRDLARRLAAETAVPMTG